MENASAVHAIVRDICDLFERVESSGAMTSWQQTIERTEALKGNVDITRRILTECGKNADDIDEVLTAMVSAAEDDCVVARRGLDALYNLAGIFMDSTFEKQKEDPPAVVGNLGKVLRALFDGCDNVTIKAVSAFAATGVLDPFACDFTTLYATGKRITAVPSQLTNGQQKDLVTALDDAVSNVPTTPLVCTTESDEMGNVSENYTFHVATVILGVDGSVRHGITMTLRRLTVHGPNLFSGSLKTTIDQDVVQGILSDCYVIFADEAVDKSWTPGKDGEPPVVIMCPHQFFSSATQFDAVFAANNRSFRPFACMPLQPAQHKRFNQGTLNALFGDDVAKMLYPLPEHLAKDRERRKKRKLMLAQQQHESIRDDTLTPPSSPRIIATPPSQKVTHASAKKS